MKRSSPTATRRRPHQEERNGRRAGLTVPMVARPSRASGSSTWARTRRRSAALLGSRAPRSSGRAARRQRLHAHHGAVRRAHRRGPTAGATPLAWAVEGPGPAEHHAGPAAGPRARPVPAPRRHRRRRVRELPPAPRALAHRARRPRPRLVTVRISVFGQDGPWSGRPGLDRSASATASTTPSPATRPPAGPGPGHHQRLPHRRVRGAGTTAALYARTPGAGPAQWSTPSLRVGAAGARGTLAGYDVLGTVAGRGQPPGQLRPFDNYPTGDGRATSASWRDRTPTPPAVQAAGADPNGSSSDPVAPTSPTRPRRSDERSTTWSPSLDLVTATSEISTAASPRGAGGHRLAQPTSSPTSTWVPGDLVTVDDPVIGPVRQQAPFPASWAPRYPGARGRPAARRAHRRGPRASVSATTSGRSLHADGIARPPRPPPRRPRSGTGFRCRGTEIPVPVPGASGGRVPVRPGPGVRGGAGRRRGADPDAAGWRPPPRSIRVPSEVEDRLRRRVPLQAATGRAWAPGPPTAGAEQAALAPGRAGGYAARPQRQSSSASSSDAGTAGLIAVPARCGTAARSWRPPRSRRPRR